MIHRSPSLCLCLYISQPPFRYHFRIVRATHPTNQALLLSHIRCALHVLSRPTPMGGDHNTHCEPPPTPHQPGAWNMIPTTTTKEGT